MNNHPFHPDFNNVSSVALLGYGKENKAMEVFLKKNFPNLNIGILDKVLDKDYLLKQSEYEMVIKTPGVPPRDVSGDYTTQTRYFFHHDTSFKIGVTATKGKSTTSSLIHHIIETSGKEANLLGNIGSPVIESLSENKTDTVSVLELSSYQLNDLDHSPHIAVVLNLDEAHLEHHDGIENYHEAKKNILRHQNESGLFVYNGKDPKLVEWAKEAPGSIIDFSLEDVSMFKSPLLGAHNIENLQAAVSVSRYLKISDEIITQALSTFTPLPHRLEHSGVFKEITFYNDSIATLPRATIAALEAIPNVDTIFLGGKDVGVNMKDLTDKIIEKDIKNIVLFPDAGSIIIPNETLFTVLHSKDMKEAVEFAYKHTRPGKVCLLSTACPSTNIWKNFEERGNLFKQYVEELGRL